VELAFVAAMQHLPARQRAVLILREVLAWPAAEVAEALGTTTAAVNSALQRARAQLAEAAPVAEEMAEPDDSEQREVLERYVAAFVEADVAALVRLLRKDAELEMPPMLNWFVGVEAIERFYLSRMRPDRWRMIMTRANGQPAVGAYRRGEDGVHHAHSIVLVTAVGGRISRIVAFADPRLHAIFGLPMVAR
jgi:RNA polymerase sigma-70 factor (ECF subfamily)